MNTLASINPSYECELGGLGLSVAGLGIKFKNRQILAPLSFGLKNAKVLGVVGESGSGKSSLARAILGILSSNLNATGEIRLACAQKQVAFIPQDPFNAFDPLASVATHFCRTPQDLSKAEIITLLAKLGISEPKRVLKAKAHELSGGEKARILIALALAKRPKILIADEPTSPLDTQLAVQILAILKSELMGLKCATIFITHDLTAARSLCDEILLLRSGVVMEMADAKGFFATPKSEYAKELLSKNELLDRSLRDAAGFKFN